MNDPIRASNVSPVDIARAIGRTRRFVDMLAAGRKKIGPDKVVALAEAIHVTADVVVEWYVSERNKCLFAIGRSSAEQ